MQDQYSGLVQKRPSSILEASLPMQIQRAGKTPIQYIREVRALAEQFSNNQRKAERFDESFALVSGQASIVEDDP